MSPLAPPSQQAELLAELRKVLAEVQQVRSGSMAAWGPHLHRPSFRTSAENLASYIGLRRWDLRELQNSLSPLGLSSLGRCEGHVEVTLEAVIQGLERLLGEGQADPEGGELASRYVEHARRLKTHTEELLGPRPTSRRTRIMVTLPAEAAQDPELVDHLVQRGMDCARINLAHDGPEAWEAMAANVRQASERNGRPCRILMDLAGQKLRTGNLAAAAPSLRIKIKRDQRGTIRHPAGVVLDGSGEPGRPAQRDGLGGRTPAHLAVPLEWLQGFRTGDRITFRDLTGRHREFLLRERLRDSAWFAVCETNAFLEPGMELLHLRAGSKKKGRPAQVGPMVAPPPAIIVHVGDFLRLTGPDELGRGAVHRENGELESCASIPCQEPGVFPFLSRGDRVFIDDGVVAAEVVQAHGDSALLRIVWTRGDGERVQPEKGINFPDSHLRLPSLTPKDLEDLAVARDLADFIGFSFVQEPEDLDELHEVLAPSSRPIGVVAKIETALAVRNLPELIVRGAGRGPFGVMIARGDLAVELGFERLAELQEEILWVCEAAHVPVIWATQVLESMVKKGQPSRAEITDAAMSMRAECVMLNKGPRILEAITLLDNVISRMQAHQVKKTPQLRALSW